MNLRESFEEREFQELSPYAAHSRNSRGRDRYEPECDIRTVYQRDRDRILHSKAFRRMKDKTQVFLAAQGDHYRTRLTHTLEVSQIARTIARALNLNEDLTEAIALGHDLGHTPFGHAGERALNRLCPGGFSHYRQSLRVVDYLERDGQGLDLTWEVRNGIVTHTSGAWARTPEGCVVRRADHIAFLNHDIEDAITAGVLDARQLPPEAVAVLGHTKSERITTMITDLVAHSGNGKINFSPEVEAAYAARGIPADNVKIASLDIERLGNAFTPEDRVSRIYINFCNPWSKNAGSNKHRLTHPRQLLQYRALMPEGSEIYFKTDDDDLFRDSLGYFPAAGFEITWQTFDLHKNEPDWNLRTEHEGMFSEQGIPIKALIARKGPDSSVTWVEPKELARRLEPEEEADPAGEVQE